jgi:hypothetical protein
MENPMDLQDHPHVEVCPECGQAFDPTRLSETIIHMHSDMDNLNLPDLDDEEEN